MGSPFGDGECLLLTLHTEPLRTSIVFNANRPHARPAAWQDPVRADQYRQLVFKSTVK
jgi:hypothetical protein